jgi:hypothetical protein
MKRIAAVLITLAPFLFFPSCKKSVDQIAPALLLVRNQQSLEVDEYHLPDYDYALVDFPLLFRKKYDGSGHLQEIDLAYEDDMIANYNLEHDLIVREKGLQVFLLSKADLSDTSVAITLNITGRVVSIHVKRDVNDLGGYGDTEYFLYRDNRVSYIQYVPDPNKFSSGNSTDTVYYDTHGNPSAFMNNHYQYDYTKKMPFQFYIDDQMEGDIGFYICQYLGYFPEVTSPPNLRTHVQADEFNDYLGAYQYDAAGRLVSYGYFSAPGNYGVGGGVTIAWHLRW